MNQCKNGVESVLKNIGYCRGRKFAKKLFSINYCIISQAKAAENLFQMKEIIYIWMVLKRFKVYGGFQASTNGGNFSLSHQIMASGNADSYMKATNETFTALAEAITDI